MNAASALEQRPDTGSVLVAFDLDKPRWRAGGASAFTPIWMMAAAAG